MPVPATSATNCAATSGDRSDVSQLQSRYDVTDRQDFVVIAPTYSTVEHTYAAQLQLSVVTPPPPYTAACDSDLVNNYSGLELELPPPYEENSEI